MQPNNSSIQNLKDKLIAILKSAGELSKLQVTIIGTLLVLIMFGSLVAYMRARPRDVSLKESKQYANSEKKPTLTVHVAGAVARPGLYRLTEGSRVADALSMAGGATTDGILDDVNLASRVKDGEKILVPRSGGGETGPGSPQQATGSALININTAGEPELDQLPGIGPSLAKRIVEYRRKKGPFSTVEELDNVDGIGPSKLEEIKSLVTI
jgi:competence protein ComEA